MEQEIYQLLLTNREKKVYELLIKGLRNREIANLMGITENTVKNHLKKIYKKFNVSSRIELSLLINNCNIDYNISGLWLSRYEYVTKYFGDEYKGIQYNIEKIVSSKIINNFNGKSLLSKSNRNNLYTHSFDISLKNETIFGTWKNINSKDLGVFLLSISNNYNIMSGKYLGINSNMKIKSGVWEWIKIKGIEITNRKMLNFKVLEKNFFNWLKEGSSIEIKDLFQ